MSVMVDGDESFLSLMSTDAICDDADLLATPVAFCFAEGTPADVVAAFNANMHTAPGPLAYFLGGRWSGSQGSPRALTWSFVPDGLSIPSSGTGDPSGNSELFSRMDSLFGGNRALWIAQFQDSFDRWEELTGASYTRVTSGGNDWDSGVFWGASGGSGRGDIRIAMRNIDGSSGVLAFNFFPSNGDMVIDRSENWASGAPNYRFLRNTVMHEHGHGLGIEHVCPTNQTKLMEPFNSTLFDGPQHDDIRAGQRHYGDPFENNNSIGAASNLGTLATGPVVVFGPTPTPVVSLGSTLSIDANGENDYFQFTTTGPRLLDIALVPIGNSYDSSIEDTFGCLSGNIINSLSIANLNLQVIDTNGSTVLAAGNSQPTGASEILFGVSLPVAGTYYVRVHEGNSPTASQLYQLQFQLTDPGCITNPDCDDLQFCNGTETCAANICQNGTSPCTDPLFPFCDETNDQCDECADDFDCTDGLFCTGVEKCDASGSCFQATGPPCTNPLFPFCDETNDECDACANNTDCDDGVFCNGAETCDATGACQPGADPCPNPSLSVCDETGLTCVACLTGADCDDGQFCTGTAACDPSNTCVPGSDPCTNPLFPFCDETNDECDECSISADCDNNIFCDGTDICDATGACQPGGAACPNPQFPFCDEANDECDECVDSADCDDGLFCNGTETCDAGGACVAGTDPCTNPAFSFCDETNDECDACTANAHCDDGLFCNGAETCDAGGACAAGTDPCGAAGCDEGNDVCLAPPGACCLPDGTCDDTLTAASCQSMMGDFRGEGVTCPVVPACVTATTIITTVLGANTAKPGTTVPMELLIEEAPDLRGYEVVVTITRTSGAGTLTAACPGAVVIDHTRCDAAFFEQISFSAANCALLRVLSAMESGSVAIGATPKYLGDYMLDISADAIDGTTFEITVVPSPTSLIANAASVFLPFVIGPPAILTVQSGACSAPTADSLGSRHLSVTPPPGKTSVALLVKGETCGLAPCVSLYIQADGSLDTTPVFQSSTAWGTIIATGPEIVPSENIVTLNEYGVRTDCGSPGSPDLSLSTTGTMGVYGDLNGSFVANLEDLLIILDALEGDLGGFSVEELDLAPCNPDGILNLEDLLAMLDELVAPGFPCPNPCP